MQRVAFLGPRGTFSEEAARTYAGAGDGVELVPYRTIPELLRDVENGQVPEGIVPAENSIEGSVVVTLDMLVHDVNLLIQREIVIPVRHHLMARKGMSLADVTTVTSHPQALAQCRRHLETLVPGAEQRPATSTAGAAREVSLGQGAEAAVGTALAAELYGLTVVASDMQDVEDNATRFFAVGRVPSQPSGCDKTSIVLAFSADRPGNLYTVLHLFAERQINLTKLESRPAKRSLGDYIFFIDLEGHREEPGVSEVLSQIQERTAFLKILGSYPRVMKPAPSRTRQFGKLHPNIV